LENACFTLGIRTFPSAQPVISYNFYIKNYCFYIKIINIYIDLIQVKKPRLTTMFLLPYTALQPLFHNGQTLTIKTLKGV
jgi:hypothetical protein